MQTININTSSFYVLNKRLGGGGGYILYKIQYCICTRTVCAHDSAHGSLEEGDEEHEACDGDALGVY